MGKIIRPTYPIEVSIGVLLLIFGMSFFLSHQIFDVHKLDEGETVYFGMFLVASAVIVVMLVLWEEFLFPIKVKSTEGGVEFRNHRAKLKKQLTIWLAIPAIYAFIYFNFDVNHVRFFIWAGICTVGPLAGKIISGNITITDERKKEVQFSPSFITTLLFSSLTRKCRLFPT